MGVVTCITPATTRVSPETAGLAKASPLSLTLPVITRTFSPSGMGTVAPTFFMGMEFNPPSRDSDTRITPTFSMRAMLLSSSADFMPVRSSTPRFWIAFPSPGACSRSFCST